MSFRQNILHYWKQWTAQVDSALESLSEEHQSGIHGGQKGGETPEPHPKDVWSPVRCTAQQEQTLKELHVTVDSLKPLMELVRQKHPQAHWIGFDQVTSFSRQTLYHAYVYDQNHQKLDVLNLNESLAPWFRYRLQVSLVQPQLHVVDPAYLDSMLRSAPENVFRQSIAAFRV